MCEKCVKSVVSRTLISTPIGCCHRPPWVFRFGMVNSLVFREMREFGQCGQDVAVRWRHFEGTADGEECIVSIFGRWFSFRNAAGRLEERDARPLASAPSARNLFHVARR